MGSLPVSSELLEEKTKKIRITNTFDKEAFITCNVQLSHEEIEFF